MKRNPKSKGTILTNDPSMTAWGYAVLDWSGKILKSGCIITKPSGKKSRIRKSDDRCRRVSEINAKLLTLIEENNVQFIISELPHGSQNASAAVMIGIVIGILQTISDSLHIGLEWYSENDVKKFLFNRMSVTKQEMVELIKEKTFDRNPEWFKNIKFRDEAVADSLGIYFVALNQSAVLKFANTMV